jgi:hypothetical protein
VKWEQPLLPAPLIEGSKGEEEEEEVQCLYGLFILLE